MSWQELFSNPLFLSIVGTSLTLLGGRVLTNAQAKKTLSDAYVGEKVGEADAAGKLTGSALSIVDRYEKRFDEMNRRIDSLDNEVQYLRQGLSRNVAQMIASGMTPVFIPEIGKVF